MLNFYKLNYGEEATNLIGKVFKYTPTNSKFSILGFDGATKDYPLSIRFNKKVASYSIEAVKQMILENELIEIKKSTKK